jgi:glucose-1-phosphate thymidylyltransferase
VSRRGPGDVIGLVPAAGHATRLGRLPCSKEVLPLAPGPAAPGRTPPPRVVAEHLLAALAQGGIGRAVVVLRSGKWDIPAYFAAGAAVELAYRVVAESPTVVHTLAAARPFVGQAVVALGFPDILFTPTGIYRPLLARLEASGADAVLALVPTRRADKADMVTADRRGRVVAIECKPQRTGAGWTWVGAVWRPTVSDYLEAWIARRRARPGAEAWPGQVLGDGLGDGLAVEAVRFPRGGYLDIGTPDDLARALAGHGPDGPGRKKWPKLEPSRRQ